MRSGSNEGDRWKVSGPWLLLRALRALLRRAGLEWSRVLLFDSKAAPPSGDATLLRFTTPSELPAELAPLQKALPRFACGDVALAIRDRDGRLACTGWLATGRRVEVKEVARPLELGAGEAWLYDCATPPELRGQGHFPALLRAAVRHHLASGGSRLLVGALDWNRSSVRAIRKAGFRPAGQLSLLKPGPREAPPRFPQVRAPGSR